MARPTWPRGSRGSSRTSSTPGRPIETRDERRAAFSLDTFSDSKFLVATGVSILTLLLTTAFGPLQAFLKTTSMDVRQWLICLAVALSIVVVSEIRKAVRRHAAPAHQETR